MFIPMLFRLKRVCVFVQLQCRQPYLSAAPEAHLPTNIYHIFSSFADGGCMALSWWMREALLLTVVRQLGAQVQPMYPIPQAGSHPGRVIQVTSKSTSAKAVRRPWLVLARCTVWTVMWTASGESSHHRKDWPTICWKTLLGTQGARAQLETGRESSSVTEQALQNLESSRLPLGVWIQICLRESLVSHVWEELLWKRLAARHTAQWTRGPSCHSCDGSWDMAEIFLGCKRRRLQLGKRFLYTCGTSDRAGQSTALLKSLVMYWSTMIYSGAHLESNRPQNIILWCIRTVDTVRKFTRSHIHVLAKCLWCMWSSGFSRMSCSEGCLAILSRACARGVQVARTPCAVTGLKWFHILVTSLLAICGFRKDVKVIARNVVRIASQIAGREPWTTQCKCINISFMAFMSDLFWNPNALCLQQSEELNNMSQWCPSLF